MILTKGGIDHYIIYDLESGAPYEVSKDYYEQYNTWMLRMWEDAMPKLNNNYKGTLIVGTAGDFDSQNSNFQEMFYNPNNTFNIVSFPNVWEAKHNTKLNKYFMPREFKQPEPLGDDDKMPSGKYKDTLMKDVPAKYLLYIYENDMCSERVKEYITNNLDIIRLQAKSE